RYRSRSSEYEYSEYEYEYEVRMYSQTSAAGSVRRWEIGVKRRQPTADCDASSRLRETSVEAGGTPAET
ncbi:hypothetical protein JXA88_06150, partial [Candidatus Fermentibacteria bacterium]|nr:hypothetical protein [Candidatus Fermentibacteria bacterium]